MSTVMVEEGGEVERLMGQVAREQGLLVQMGQDPQHHEAELERLGVKAARGARGDAAREETREQEDSTVSPFSPPTSISTTSTPSSSIFTTSPPSSIFTTSPPQVMRQMVGLWAASVVREAGGMQGQVEEELGEGAQGRSPATQVIHLSPSLGVIGKWVTWVK